MLLYYVFTPHRSHRNTLYWTHGQTWYLLVINGYQVKKKFILFLKNGLQISSMPVLTNNFYDNFFITFILCWWNVNKLAASLCCGKIETLKEKGLTFAYTLIYGWFSYLHSHVWCSTKVISTYSLSGSDGLIFSSWGIRPVRIINTRNYSVRSNRSHKYSNLWYTVIYSGLLFWGSTTSFLQIVAHAENIFPL